MAAGRQRQQRRNWFFRVAGLQDFLPIQIQTRGHVGIKHGQRALPRPLLLQQAHRVAHGGVGIVGERGQRVRATKFFRQQRQAQLQHPARGGSQAVAMTAQPLRQFIALPRPIAEALIIPQYRHQRDAIQARIRRHTPVFRPQAHGVGRLRADQIIPTDAFEVGPAFVIGPAFEHHVQ